MTLLGRELILGVGGGISAYKSAELLRRMQDIGFGISVIPTRSSLNFVGTATWEALSGRPIKQDLWENVHEVPHIKIARTANLIVIAPATADLIAKIASGIADDLLTNVVSAARCPIVMVPAMHPEMWLSSANQENVSTLRSRGVLVIEPDEGRMTGDDYGLGRYPEIARIISEISSFAELKSDLLGKKVLVTAGGTRESIDPVRYIGNHSSGKQGYALAIAARNRGAEVVLISANSTLQDPQGIKILKVVSAIEMREALTTEFQNTSILLMAAAVADARPLVNSNEKIKKENFEKIELQINPDLLKQIGEKRGKGQVLVGFAAETNPIDEQVIEVAKSKMRSKGADLIFLNDVSNGAIFGEDKTSGILIDSSGATTKCGLQGKDTLADLLLDRALDKLG
jgi:phosphopantothenoylcysteine decarboxylase/phosphopantothenate--cysteine ligase